MRRDIEGRMRRGLRKVIVPCARGLCPLRGHGGDQVTKFPPPTRRSIREGSEAISGQGNPTQDSDPDDTPTLDRAPTSLSANLGADAMFYAASGSSPAGGRALSGNSQSPISIGRSNSPSPRWAIVDALLTSRTHSRLPSRPSAWCESIDLRAIVCADRIVIEPIALVSSAWREALTMAATPVDPPAVLTGILTAVLA
jgi:hypothetical protein